MAGKKIKGFATHLQAKHFKNSKAKTKHELQHEILSMSHHQLAVIDELVRKASEGKTLDKLHYPIHDIKQFAAVARKYKGHTHSQVALARKARQTDGGGLGSLFNASKAIAAKGAKQVVRVAKAGSKAAMKAGKALMKGGKKAVTWAMKNPREAILIGSTVVPVASALLAAGEEEYTDEDEKIEPHQREAIDALLDTTDEEDTGKKGGRIALKPLHKQRKGGASRWVI